MTDIQRWGFLRHLTKLHREQPHKALAYGISHGLLPANATMDDVVDRVKAFETKRLANVGAMQERRAQEDLAMDAIWSEATAPTFEAVDTGWPSTTTATVIDRCRNRHMVRIKLEDEREALMWRGRLRWPIGSSAPVRMSEYREDTPIYEAVKDWDAAAVV